MKNLSFNTSFDSAKKTNLRVIILGGALSIIILLLFTNTSDAYARIFSGLLSQSLKNQGIVFDIQNPTLKGLSLSGDSSITRLENGPIFQLIKPSLSFELLPLLSATSNALLKGTFYNGEVLLHSISNFFSQNQSLDGRVQNVNLALVPILRIYGVYSGYSTMLFKNIALKKSLPVGGQLLLSIAQFKRSKDKVISSSLHSREARMANFTLDSMAANLEISTLKIETTFEPESSRITNITLDSSLGQMSGSGTITNLQTSPSVDITVHIILSEKGKKTIVPLLSLTPQYSAVANKDLTEFNVTFKGSLQRPLWTIEPSTL